MDFNRDWTAFALDAEVDAFGTHRIAQHYNNTASRLREVEAEVKRLNGILDELYEANGGREMYQILIREGRE